MTRSLSLLVAVSLAGSTLGCSTFFPSDPTPPATTNADGGPSMTGCAATSKHVAPGGYYVNGNTICTESGQPHMLHGVDRPSLEWQPGGDNILPSDFALMASWKANVVRIALNQDFWLQGSKYYSASYASTVDDAVRYAEQAGMDVILDLHWSDRGMLGSCDPSNGCQQVMADMNSITFWSEVASIYKNDGRVMFELYNEPHDVPWNVWQSGGMSGGFQVAGMQQLYQAVRDAQADNVVIIGGLSWAADLSGVPDYRITGYNIAYATHPYNNSAPARVGGFDSGWGFLTRTDPVVVTEFGDGMDCNGDAFTTTVTNFYQAVITYADQHGASWTSWAWYPGGCKFPSLITDWTGTPTAAGTLVHAALAGYNEPAPDGKRDGGTVDAGGTTADGGQDAGGSAPHDGGATDAAAHG
ncbi:MAG TPA: glycoside hydrolase family 5 protein [Polyangia bacterium]|nr:glycoside hydrolase family 5 protein [Polyangia bacterium]